MSALGQQQPVTMLSAWRLLSCVNRPFGDDFLEYSIFNVSSHYKQSFKVLEKPFCEGRESATSGRNTARFIDHDGPQFAPQLVEGSERHYCKECRVFVPLSESLLPLLPQYSLRSLPAKSFGQIHT